MVELGPHLTQYGLGRSISSGILIHQAVWPQQTWAKICGLCHFAGTRSPYSTIWPGPRPTSIPSGSLSIQPFGRNTPTSQTDRTDRQRTDSIGQTVIWATVCKTVRPMLSVRCLSVLSVTFVHCSQTVGRIKIKLFMQVGLGPGNIVLDGDQAPPPPKGTAPNFRSISVAAKWLHGSRCHLVWS